MRSSGGAATARPTTPRPSARAAVSSLTLKNLVLSHRDGPTPPVRRACRVEVRARHLRARARAVCATSRQKERRPVSPSSALECGHATVVVASGQSVVRARLDTELVEEIRNAHDPRVRSEEHTSELQSHSDLVCRLLLEKKKKMNERR